MKDRKFDGFIITGAPVETLPFEEVTYWPELQEILDWTETNVHSTMNVCWGGMAAAIYHFHKVPKHPLKEKAFGVYRHRNLAPSSVYLNGFSDDFQVPVSRWTEVRREDIEKVPELKILLESEEMGVCLVQEKRANRSTHVQPCRIRFHLAGRRIFPRQVGGDPDQAAAQTISRTMTTR